MPQVVVLNKIDLPHVAESVDTIMKDMALVMSHKRLLCMSAASRIGVDEVVDRTYKFLNKIKKDKCDIDVLQKEKDLKELSEQLEKIGEQPY